MREEFNIYNFLIIKYIMDKSSSFAQTVCFICFTKADSQSKHSNPGCGHTYCVACLTKYQKVQNVLNKVPLDQIK